MDESAAPAEPVPVRAKPRIPWLAALLCAASLVAAAWTWMRYSYAWEIAAEDFRDDGARNADRYVSVRCTVSRVGHAILVTHLSKLVHAQAHIPSLRFMECTAATDPSATFSVVVASDRAAAVGEEIVCSGRYVPHEGRFFFMPRSGEVLLFIDGATSRFHPASIAGIVVGAMGCFVFALYLRRWLRERKAAA